MFFPGPIAPASAYHPTRLLVRAPLAAVRAAVPRTNVTLVRYMPEIGWAIVETNGGRDRAAMVLRKQPGVALVTLDRAARLSYTPNDPMWGNQWHMRTIKADLAWDTSKGSAVSVAVIDTGVLRTHEDLASQMWENMAEIAGNGLDDDANGYIDDRYGWDFAYNDNNPEDAWGHGTPCSGIVGARQDNLIGGTGVAPFARIMAIKACDHNGYLYDSYLVPAYLYATAMGARVFSMSYFSDRVSLAERDALDYAWSQGVLPVAAAGNAASVIPFYPSAYRNVLSVAAVNSALQKSGFSCYGAVVDVAAPGEGLTTTGSDGAYTGFGGTSGACPHVAGLATLLFGAVPAATNAQVMTAIEDSALTVSQSPFGEFANYGVVDAQAALAALLSGQVDPKPFSIRFVSLLGQRPLQTIGVGGRVSSVGVSRVFGRGFQAFPGLTVRQGGSSVPILSRGRDWLDIGLTSGRSGNLTFHDGAVQLGVVPCPTAPALTHPMSEASSPGATVSGGFTQTLLDDSVSMSCGADGDGNLNLQTTFHGVFENRPLSLKIRHRTSVAWAPGFDVYTYDWNTASYPYGSWVKLGELGANTTFATTAFAIPNPSSLTDDEGVIYLRVTSKSVIPSGAQLLVDSLRLDR